MNKKNNKLRDKAEEILKKRGIDNKEFYQENLEKLIEELNIYQIELEHQNNELREIQLNLEKTNSQYADLYHKAPVGYFTIDKDNRILNANEKALTLLKISKNEILKSKFTRFVLPEFQDQYYHHHRIVINENKQDSCEIKIVSKSNKEYYVQLESIPTKETDSGEIALRTAVLDITEKKKNELENLKQVQILNSISDSVIVTDFNGIITHWNHGAEEIFGYTQNEMLGKTPAMLYPDLDASKLDYDLEKIKNGQDYIGEWNGRRKDGQIVWVHIRTSIYFDNINKPIGFLGVAKDITERKLQEIYQLQHASIVEYSNDGIESIDVDGNILSWNKGAAQIYGYDAAEMIGKNALLLYTKENRDELKQNLAKIRKGEIVKNYETQRKHKNGNIIDVSITFSPLINTSGEVLGASIITRDITEQVQNEKALKESKLKYQTIFEDSGDGILVMRKDGIIDCNKQVCHMLGYDKEEIINKTPMYFSPTHQEDGSFSEVLGIKYIQQALEKGYCAFNWQHQKKDKTIINTRINLKRIELKGEKVLLSIMHDLTDIFNYQLKLKERNEEILAQNEEYQALNEELHEANQQLQIANTNIDLSERKFRTAFKTSPDAVNINRLSDGLYVEINEGFTKLTGFTEEFVKGKTSKDINIWANPEDRDKLVKSLKANGYCANLEAQFQRKDGTIITGLMSASFIEINNEKCILSITRDISERKELEEIIHQNEQKYRQLVEESHAIVWEYSITDDKWTYVSPQSKTILNIDPSEWSNLEFWTNNLHPEDRDWASKYCFECALKGENHTFEYRFKTKDGNYVWLRDVVSVEMKNQAPIILRGLMVDITEAKETSEKVSQQKQYLNTLLQTAMDGFWIINSEGRFIDVNEAYCKMIGYSKEEIRNMSIQDFDIVENPEETKARMERIVKNGSEIFETKHIRKDKTVMIVEVSVTFLNLEKGQFICFCRDISERRIFEMQKNQQLYFSKALNEIAEIIISNNNAEDIFEQANRIVGETLQLDKTLIRNISFETNKITCLSEWLNPLNPKSKSTKGEYVSLEMFSSALTVINKKKIYIESHNHKINKHFLNSDASKILHDKLNIQSLLWYPFGFYEGGYYLFTMSQINKKREWTNPELQFMNSVAKQVSLALIKINLLEEKRRDAIRLQEKNSAIELNNNRLESLLRVSQFHANSMQALLDYALKEAIELTESKIGYIYFYDENTCQFSLNTWSKEVMKECAVLNPQTIYDLDKTGCWGDAVRERKPVIINDYKADNPNKKGVPKGHISLSKFLTIPVIIDNKIVAVAGVANKPTDYNNADIRQLTLLMDNVWKISERIALIDNLKSAKEKTEENEKQLKKAQETAKTGNWVWYIKENKLWWSDEMYNIFGIDKDSFTGELDKVIDSVIHPDDRYIVEHSNSSVVNYNKPIPVEYRIITRNGLVKHVYGLADEIVLDENGKSKVLTGIVKDITDFKLIQQELQKAKEKAEESEKKFKSIVKLSPDAIFIYRLEADNRLVLTDANPSAERIIGISPKTLIGKTIEEAFPNLVQTDIPELYRKIARREVDNQSFEITYTDERFSGYYSVKVYATQANSIVVHFIEISDRKKLELDLIAAKEKAEESDRLKSAFLANMSHEIRTPMNSIMGFSQLLREKEVTKEKHDRFLEIITDRSRDLLRIINDIIDISKIEANLLTIEESEFSINKLLLELYTSFESEIQKENRDKLKLVLETDFNKENALIVSDQDRLKQVLINLIFNAIKFTSEGKVEFGYYLNTNRELEFYVKDTGIGISKNAQEMVFERFRQADDSTTRKYGGTGLGLPISKNIVKLLGGRIWVESEPGMGSTFYFTIPYKVKNEIADTKIEDQIVVKYNWNEKKVLIVEDDSASLYYLIELLEPTKIAIEKATKGSEVHYILDNNANIDMVLLDINLPEIDGNTLIKQIKEKRPKMPVIAQTAYSMNDEKKISLGYGFDDYITKPIDVKLLLSVMHKYFNL